MKTNTRTVHLTVALVWMLLMGASGAHAQDPVPQEVSQPLEVTGTAFTYQGRLTDGGLPANNVYDLTFTLYDATSGGNQVGVIVTMDDIAVMQGLFTVSLDFGSNIFTGDARYLEIGVRPGGSTGSFSVLQPRQALTPAPYALALPGLYTLQNGVSPSLVGGYGGNAVGSDVIGATIGGGGASDALQTAAADYTTIGGGAGNRALATDTTVGGGRDNTADGGGATVGGGNSNLAAGQNATVAGGETNLVSVQGGAIGGGRQNVVQDQYGTVGGGESNVAGDGGGPGDASHATVGGGRDNAAAAYYATVSGGRNNSAGGWYTTVGGGNSNSASAYGATVPGGWNNSAEGERSFAAGRRAKAQHNGAFVWADNRNFDFKSTAENQFNARATGGFLLVTAIDGDGNLSAGVRLSAGSGSWSTLSDAAVKTGYAPVDPAALLQRLADLPIQTWHYRSQDPAIRHMGPTAQAFQATFGLGEDERYISAVDADGVALAAIQGLYRLVQAQEEEIAALQQQNVDLETRLRRLESLVAATAQVKEKNGQ